MGYRPLKSIPLDNGHTYVQAELDGLKDAHTPEAIKFYMEASPVSCAVFNRTRECADNSLDASFQGCKPILDLRKKAAQSIRKRALASTNPALRTRLDALPRPAEATAIEGLVGQSLR